MPSPGEFLAVIFTEKLLLLGAVVFHFDDLKRSWLFASFHAALLRIGVRIEMAITASIQGRRQARSRVTPLRIHRPPD
jgi:hypothetical protein